jgi:L-ectoine synthase
MLVRKIGDILGSEREVHAPNRNWVSRRMLLKDDRMGFSLHETIISSGTETLIWNKNHLEAVYCIDGEGEDEIISEGKLYPISPGTMYALVKNDRHYLRAFSDMRLICVFNPALVGSEVHQEDGSYPLL